MTAHISTDRSAQAAKPGKNGKRLDYPVKGSPGLRLRVTGTAKIWSLLYTRKSDGKRCRVTLGEYPAMTLATACGEAGKHRNDVRIGADPAQDRRAEKTALTLGRLAERWLERYAKANRKRPDEAARIIGKDILPVLGGFKADAVTKKDVIRCVDAVLDRGAPVMANRTLGIIGTIFSWALSEDLVDKNPAAGIRKRAPESPRERKMLPEEIVLFWRGVVTSSMTPEVKDILCLCLLLGQRVNEVAQAAKSEFDLASGVWEIPAGRVKNGRAHRLPLPRKACEILAGAFARSPNSAWAFPSPAKLLEDCPMTEKAVSRAWTRARHKFGLDIRVHDLRRSFASLAGDLGIDDYHIGLVLNHQGTRSAITSIYNRAKYDPQKRNVLEAVERRLMEIVEGREPESNVVSLRA